MLTKLHSILLAGLLLALLTMFSPAALGAINAPGNLTVTKATYDSITMIWSDNASNEDGYCVQRFDPSISDWVTISPQLAKDVTSYTDTGLQQGTTYEYRVYAYAQSTNAIDFSSYSNTASGTTMAQLTVPTVPAAPTNLTAVSTSSSSIVLYWVDNANNEDGFRVERQESGTGIWAVVTVAAADAMTFTDTGLAPGTKYFYRVVAYNNAGESNLSNTADATTEGTAPPPFTIVPTIMKFFMGSTQYTLDGVLQTMDAAPIEQYSRMLLPIRYVVEPLGITPVWDGISKVTIQNSTTTIELWLDQNTASVNGIDKLIDPDNPNVMPVTVPPGRVMLPLRFVSENLGCSAVWDPTPPGSATITYPGGP